MSKIIMGIQLQQRHDTARAVQDILTDFGCFIKTRVGVHQTYENACTELGLILIEFMNDVDDEAAKMEQALSELNYVTVKTMKFE